MKKILFVLAVAAFIGCQKNDSVLTTAEISATDAETGLPIDSVRYYVTHDNWDGGYEHASERTRHGHCRIAFDAEQHLNYWWFSDNTELQGYTILSPAETYDFNRLTKGNVNKIDVVYARPALLELGYENVNYTGQNIRVCYRITSPNYSSAPQVEYSWNYYYSGIPGGTNPNFIFYDLAAMDYLVEWTVYTDGGAFIETASETISLSGDSTTYYNLQY